MVRIKGLKGLFQPKLFYDSITTEMRSSTPICLCCQDAVVKETKIVPVQGGGKFTIRNTVINTNTWKFDIDLAALKTVRGFSPT